MKLILWNVNGIRAGFSKGLEQFILEEKPDILCLQEVKANIEQVANIIEGKFLDYQVFFSSAQKKGYSGVATFIRSKLAIDDKKVKKTIEQPIYDNEGRFLITNFKDFDLYNIYFPSGTTGEIRQKFKYSFLDSLYKFFENMSRAQLDRAIVCGDFNICHKEIDIHHPQTASKLELSGFLPAERAWMDKFVELGFADTFRLINGEKKDSYSWWTFRANARAKNLGWRIDYFFVSKKIAAKVKDASIMSTVMGSDHCPITLILK